MNVLGDFFFWLEARLILTEKLFADREVFISYFCQTSWIPCCSSCNSICWVTWNFHVWRWPLHLKHLSQRVGFELLSSPLSALTELKRLRALFWEWEFYVTDPPMPRACFELGFGSGGCFSRFDLLTNHKDLLHITVRILFCFCIIHVFIGTGL